MVGTAVGLAVGAAVAAGLGVAVAAGCGVAVEDGLVTELPLEWLEPDVPEEGLDVAEGLLVAVVVGFGVAVAFAVADGLEVGVATVVGLAVAEGFAVADGAALLAVEDLPVSLSIFSVSEVVAVFMVELVSFVSVLAVEQAAAEIIRATAKMIAVNFRFVIKFTPY